MSDTDTSVLTLADEAATARLGGVLARLLTPGTTVALSGDLGAGKSALTRAAIRAATGDPDEDVPSPTFTLVQTYEAADGTEWWHFDLYRLERPDDALELGIEEAFTNAVCMIEWPERLGPWLPRSAVRIALTITADGARRAAISGPGPLPARIIEEFTRD